jgi:hypothetical protein
VDRGEGAAPPRRPIERNEQASDRPPRAQGTSANGVTARILVETSEIWQQFVPPDQVTAIPFALGVSVAGGGSVNFTVEPFESNDVGDETELMYQLCQ